jgi:hypothetical protein
MATGQRYRLQLGWSEKQEDRHQHEQNHHLLSAKSHPVASEAGNPAVHIEAIVVGILEQSVVATMKELCQTHQGRTHCHCHPANSQIPNLANGAKNRGNNQQNGEDEEFPEL